MVETGTLKQRKNSLFFILWTQFNSQFSMYSFVCAFVRVCLRKGSLCQCTVVNVKQIYHFPFIYFSNKELSMKKVYVLFLYQYNIIQEFLSCYMERSCNLQLWEYEYPDSFVILVATRQLLLKKHVSVQYRQRITSSPKKLRGTGLAYFWITDSWACHCKRGCWLLASPHLKSQVWQVRFLLQFSSVLKFSGKVFYQFTLHCQQIRGKTVFHVFIFIQVTTLEKQMAKHILPPKFQLFYSSIYVM